MIGNASSALDISRDIAGFAKEVHIACKNEATGSYGKHPVYDNMWLHPVVTTPLSKFCIVIVKVHWKYCSSLIDKKF